MRNHGSRVLLVTFLAFALAGAYFVLHESALRKPASGPPLAALGGPGGGGSDTTPPTISITEPESGATVSGTISVSANASDDVGVVNVRFLLDGTINIGEDTAAPYSLPFNTTPYENGSHELTAEARDQAGNVGTSNRVAITATNQHRPNGPTNLTAQLVSSNAIQLYWDDNATNEQGYAVKRGTDSATFEILTKIGGNTREYLDVAGVPATKYYYVVAAYNGDGESVPSNIASATTEPKDEPPPEVDGGNNQEPPEHDPADVNRDGRVDISDLNAIISRWRTNDQAADLNNSGGVDIFDLSRLLRSWGT